jgi:hypothetical protein
MSTLRDGNGAYKLFDMTSKKVNKKLEKQLKEVREELKHNDLILKGFMERQDLKVFFFDMSIHYVRDRKGFLDDEDMASMTDIMRGL